MRLDLIPAAIHLHAITQDPMLLDAIRVISSRNQPPQLTQYATNTVESCLRAYFVLYGTHGNLDIPDPNGYPPPG